MTKNEYIERHGEEAWERHQEYARKYYQEHKEELKERARKYNKEHKEELKEYHREYYKTLKGRSIHLALVHRQHDQDKGFDTSRNITAEWILENIFSGQKCIYCGESNWKKLGVDRINNELGHTPENCICSCWECNKARGNKYSFEEFMKLKKHGCF